MAAFLGPGAGLVNIVLAVHVLVQRLQKGIKSHMELLTKKVVYMLATMCDPSHIKGSLASRAALPSVLAS